MGSWHQSYEEFKEIAKPGGVRLLGIPTVLDRVIQQAVARIRNRIWDHTFSEFSFGFRPKRSVHDAIRKYCEYVQSGLRYVVDIDLSKFFDRVNHDRLLARLATRVKDKRVLKLLRLDRIVQPPTSIASLDQTSTSGVSLEALASGSQSLRLGEKNRKTRVGQLLKRAVSRNYAVTTGCARKGPWRMSKVKWVNIALPDDYFVSLGLSFPWI